MGFAPASANGTLACGISFSGSAGCRREPGGRRTTLRTNTDQPNNGKVRKNNGTKKTSGMNRAHGVNVSSQDTAVTAAVGAAMKQTAELSIVTTGLSGAPGVPGSPPRGITSRE